MGAGRDEDHHVLKADDAVEFVEDGRDHQVPGLRAGAVAGRDGHRLPRAHSLAQRRSSDGVSQGRAQDGHLIRGPFVVDGFDDRRRARIHLDVKP